MYTTYLKIYFLIFLFNANTSENSALWVLEWMQMEEFFVNSFFGVVSVFNTYLSSLVLFELLPFKCIIYFTSCWKPTLQLDD